MKIALTDQPKHLSRPLNTLIAQQLKTVFMNVEIIQHDMLQRRFNNVSYKISSY